RVSVDRPLRPVAAVRGLDPGHRGQLLHRPPAPADERSVALLGRGCRAAGRAVREPVPARPAAVARTSRRGRRSACRSAREVSNPARSRLLPGSRLRRDRGRARHHTQSRRRADLAGETGPTTTVGGNRSRRIAKLAARAGRGPRAPRRYTMSCPNELELSMYADGALEPHDAARVRAHIHACAVCAERALALAQEKQVLRAAFMAQEATIRVPSFRLARANGGAMLAVALLIGLASSSLVLADLLVLQRLPQPLRWLNPLTTERLVDLLLGLLVTMATEGRSMLMSTIETLAGAAAVALLVACAILLSRRTARHGAAMLALAFATLTVAPPSDALEIRRSEGVLNVPADQTIDDTLVAFAETIEI